jgi:hypothetical protein
MICDFCSSPEPAWRCPAISFPVFEARSASEGDWAACDACASLIRAEDRIGLARRSAETFSAKYGLPFDIAPFLELHALFFEHRCGPVARIRGPANEAV